MVFGFKIFKEYLVLFWSRANGSSHDKLSLFFDMFDLNGNHYIDFHELHSIVKILLKLKYSDKNINKKNNEDDDDNNKNANFDYTSQQKYDNHNSIDSELKNYGRITYTSSLPPSYHIAMSIMKKFDLDRNAKLTKDEFIKGCDSNEDIKKFLTPLIL